MGTYTFPHERNNLEVDISLSVYFMQILLKSCSRNNNNSEDITILFGATGVYHLWVK